MIKKNSKLGENLGGNGRLGSGGGSEMGSVAVELIDLGAFETFFLRTHLPMIVR